MSNILNICLRNTVRSISYLRPNILQTIKPLNNVNNKPVLIQVNQRFATTKAFDINTNVSKDVILFKYENPKFFKMLNIFALCQLFFWTYLSHFAFTTLKDAPAIQGEHDAPWYRRINLGENKYRNTITVFCFLIGYGILVAAWMFTLRSVRLLILRKGGQSVSLVTYAPFNKNRIMDVPLKYISAQESREAARVQLPLKVKNRNFYYILDMRGEFLNQRLFDYTAGLRRKL